MDDISSRIEGFEKEIQYSFQRKDLIQGALTHPSFQQSTFEVLEFIGDRVINLVVAKLLYQDKPKNEKEYAQRFVGLTNRDSLYQAGVYMKLHEYVRWIGSQSHHKTIVQDATEAVFGAIFLDAGMEFTQEFGARVWSNVQRKRFAEVDPKSALQLWSSKKKLELKYDLIKTSGPPHDRRYVVKLSVQNYNDFFGFGQSIRNAEKEAAEKFLRAHGND